MVDCYWGSIVDCDSWLTLSKNLIAFGLGVDVARVRVVERIVKRRSLMVDGILSKVQE